MIDNRPVFNNNLGGTFWEALPVDLNDVERIEIVRGPSAPLFGPNAVTGVINIITKRATTKNYVNATAQQGTNATTIMNATVGRKFSDKISFTVSGNYQKRNRFEDLYYNPSTDGFQKPNEVFVTNADKRYPHPELALDRYGINGFLTINPTAKTSIDLSLGTQDSETQKNFLGSVEGSPFTTNRTQSHYANLSSKIYGLHVRGSVQTGKENLNVGYAPNRYDFTIADATAEYEFTVTEKYSITPGISYQTVRYDDKDYAETGPTFLDSTAQTINTGSAFLRTDLKPINNLRIIAAIRADKFSTPDDVYLAYEFATTYSINEKNLIRAAITRSNSGSFIGITKLNLFVQVAPGTFLHRYGNENVDLLTVNMVEFGYRSQLSKSLQLDFDVFAQQADHFNALLINSMLDQSVHNIPTSAKQIGTTISFNFVPSEKIQFKPFVTFQKTDTKNLASAYTNPETSPVTYSDSKHRHTPSFYGGWYLNFKASEKFNLNMNGYYFAAHRQYNATDRADVSEGGDISGEFLVNLKASYQIIKGLNVFVNGRNVFNSDSREYWGTDKIGGLYSAGASFNLN
jgi:iron complex outermembrane receptor protein